MGALTRRTRGNTDDHLYEELTCLASAKEIAPYTTPLTKLFRRASTTMTQIQAPRNSDAYYLRIQAACIHLTYPNHVHRLLVAVQQTASATTGGPR